MASIHKEEEPWKWGGGETKATLPCYGFLGLWKKVHSPGGVGVGLTGALDAVLLNPQENSFTRDILKLTARRMVQQGKQLPVQMSLGKDSR